MSQKGRILIVFLFFLCMVSIPPINASTSNNSEYVPSQLIVCFNPALFASKQELDSISSQLHAEYNATLLENSTKLGIPGAQLIRLSSNSTVEEAIEWYEGNSSVLFAEPNFIVSVPPPLPMPKDTTNDFAMNSLEGNSPKGAFTTGYPNDPYYNYQWNMEKIKVPSAWGISKGSDDVIIAILDTGIHYTHPDLSGNIWMNTDEIFNNGADDDNNGFIDDIYGWDFQYDDNTPMDDFGHGTAIASIIASEGNNDIGLAGILWNARIMSVKVGDSSGIYESNKIKGIQYAKNNGADIIICSFGNYQSSDLEQIVIDQSPDQLFVCAAGNDGMDTDLFPHYPSGYSNWNIISVAATDQSDNLCPFSNYGQNSVDVGAPGFEIPVLWLNSQYQVRDGTSYAVPHVAGLAGLILSIDPAKRPSELRQLIMDNVDINQLNGYVRSGGRINAYRTLLAVTPVPSPTPSQSPTSTSTTPIPTATPTNPPLQPDFTVSHTSGIAPLTVRFQDTSQGNPTGWMWDINGDGFMDYSDKNFEHIYTTPGDYSVTLSITRNQEFNTIIRSNYIHVLAATPTDTPSGDMAISLSTGWNCISTPRILAEGHRTLSEVFPGINTGGRSVFRYNAQSQSWTQVRSNDVLQPLQGIWIYSVAPAQVPLTFRNDQTVTPSIILSPGWNAIGFSRMNPLPAREALLPVQASWTSLFGFNAGSQVYDPSIINGGSGSHSDTNFVYPGKGYWIFMSQEGTIS